MYKERNNQRDNQYYSIKYSYLFILYHLDVSSFIVFSFLSGPFSNSHSVTLTDIPYDAVNRDSNGLRNLDKGNADIITFDLEEFLKQVFRVTSNSICIFVAKNNLVKSINSLPILVKVLCALLFGKRQIQAL